MLPNTAAIFRALFISNVIMIVFGSSEKLGTAIAGMADLSANMTLYQHYLLAIALNNAPAVPQAPRSPDHRT